MIPQQADFDIDCLLRLTFGRPVSATPIPLADVPRTRGTVYALHGEGVPPRVLLQRFLPRDQIQVMRSFTVMRALSVRQFPVPEVYYLGWSTTTQYILMLREYVRGSTISEPPHAFFRRFGRSFAHTLAELHDLAWDPPPDLAVMPFWWSFREMTERVRHLGVPQLLRILEWLLAHLNRITELPYTVIHRNYTLQNVLVNDTGIVAVQGWEQAAVGDPRFDVGHTSAVLGAHGVALSDQFLEDYRTAAGGSLPDSTFWEVFCALSLLSRMARTVDTLPTEQRNRALQQAIPAWRGLLLLVTHRTGLDLW